MLQTSAAQTSNSWVNLVGPRSAPGSAAPFAAISSASNSRADILTAEADDIIRHAFHEHFPSDLISHLGLTLVATGSYGRRMLVSGRSDIDLALFTTERSFSDLSDLQRSDLETALREFRLQITDAFRGLELEVDANIQCREFGDLKREILATHSGTIREVKIAGESVTKFCSMRALGGDQDLLEKFESMSAVAWKEIVGDREVLAQAVKLLVNAGSAIIGDHQLQVARQDVKAQPMTLATINHALIALLENDTNRDALAALRPELRDQWAFLAGVREALPREAQVLGPKGNKSVPFAVARIYGNHPGVLSQAYRTSAWIATCFEFLATEAAKADLVTLAKSSIPSTTMKPCESADDLRAVFYNSGNVALGLHLGFLQGALDSHLPELAQLNGVPDRHGYQRFTLGRHSINAVAKLDELFRGQGDPRYVRMASELSPEDKAALSFAVAMHDIGKPEEIRLGAGPEYHAGVGSGMAVEAAARLGFGVDQIRAIGSVVKHHLWLRQDKHRLRENLAKGPQSLPEDLRTSRMIRLLTLLAYADEASQDTVNWNGLRSDRLHTLCHGYTCLLEGRPNGLVPQDAGQYAQFLFSQHRDRLPGDNFAELQQHLSLFPSSYLSLPPETVCDFFKMSKARDLSSEPQARIIPHELFESDRQAGLHKYDVLIVGADKDYLASNCAKILTEGMFVVHSASFSVNTAGVVFNQFTVTSPQVKTPAMLDKVVSDLIAINRQPSLKVPNVSGFSFSEDTKMSASLCDRRETDPVVVEININTQDRNKLLLRCLTGLNKLGLSIVGAEITTTTDENGQNRANNRFFLVNPLDPMATPDLHKLKSQMFFEFRDPE